LAAVLHPRGDFADDGWRCAAGGGELSQHFNASPNAVWVVEESKQEGGEVVDVLCSPTYNEIHVLQIMFICVAYDDVILYVWCCCCC